MINKIFLTFTAILGIFALGLFAFISSAPPLPPGTDSVIAEVLHSRLPELITGKTGLAKNGKVGIWYEVINPEGTKGTILLIMGHSASALMWPRFFLQPLVDAGYRVIRFDHRGLGMSDWIKDWDKKSPYTIGDMANDTLAVMNVEKVKKAHLIGVSMGGVIAQEIALSHPDRVSSLTSIMSTGYFKDPDLPPSPKWFKWDALKLILKYRILPTEKSMIKFNLGVLELLKGDGTYKHNIKAIVQMTLYEMRKRKGYNLRVLSQHSAAMSASGSRYEILGTLKMPVLIIHGKIDPLLNIEHSKKYAGMIPGAATLWVDGMGHNLPETYMPLIMKNIFANFQRSVN